MTPDSSPDDVEDPKTVETEITPVQETEKVADVAADSSTPGATMLDTVKAALQPKATTPVADTPEKSPAEAVPAETTETDAEELAPEEVKQLSAKTQRRIRYLSSQVKSRDTELESLKPKATELDNLNRYVREAGLSNNDVAGTLEIAAMLRHNPRGALDRLMPIIKSLRSTLGEELPPELQDRVKQNFISEEDARVIARQSADAKLNERRIADLTAAQDADRQARETNDHVQGTIASATEWEAAKAKGDPDWHLKRKDVAEQVELAILKEASKRGAPFFPDRAEIVKFNEAALKTVNERFARFTPKAREIIPDNGSASPRSKAVPKTMLEVVQMAAG